MPEKSSSQREDPSPYSRTGLFPWGNTYEVPVRAEGPWFVTQTPCHLRAIRVNAAQQGARHTTRCGTCGRAWSFRITTDAMPPIAVWTA